MAVDPGADSPSGVRGGNELDPEGLGQGLDGGCDQVIQEAGHGPAELPWRQLVQAVQGDVDCDAVIRFSRLITVGQGQIHGPSVNAHSVPVVGVIPGSVGGRLVVQALHLVGVEIQQVRVCIVVLPPPRAQCGQGGGLLRNALLVEIVEVLLGDSAGYLTGSAGSLAGLAEHLPVGLDEVVMREALAHVALH